MRLRAAVLAGALALASAGCDAQPAATGASASAVTAPPSDPDSEKLPVAADYEAQAERRIDGHNYQAELDKIEQLLPPPAKPAPVEAARPSASARPAASASAAASGKPPATVTAPAKSTD